MYLYIWKAINNNNNNIITWVSEIHRYEHMIYNKSYSYTVKYNNLLQLACIHNSSTGQLFIKPSTASWPAHNIQSVMLYSNNVLYWLYSYTMSSSSWLLYYSSSLIVQYYSLAMIVIEWLTLLSMLPAIITHITLLSGRLLHYVVYWPLSYS